MRREKQLLLDDIKERLNAAQAVVIARYSKLEPNKVAGFRFDLAKTGSSLSIVKKRLLIKAVQETGMGLDPEILEGHIAVIFLAEEPISTTKLIYQFSEENEKHLQVLGGAFEGMLYSAQDVEQLSKLPNKEQMRAELLGTLEAPLSQTLAVVEALLTSVIYCLENKNQQNQSQEV